MSRGSITNLFLSPFIGISHPLNFSSETVNKSIAKGMKNKFYRHTERDN